jgi:hypothetical protein
MACGETAGGGSIKCSQNDPDMGSFLDANLDAVVYGEGVQYWMKLYSKLCFAD